MELIGDEAEELRRLQDTPEHEKTEPIRSRIQVLLDKQEPQADGTAHQGGRKRKGKKSRKSRKGKKPRKGRKSRKNKRTKRR